MAWPSRWPAQSFSHASIPLISLIAPVAASAIGKKHDPRQILRVLVSQLYRRVDTCRRAPRRIQVVTVLGVDDERLRMQRTLDIPALVIAVVERLEVHELRPRLYARDPRDLAQCHARASRHSGPSLDTEVVQLVADAWERREVGERQLQRSLN